MLHSTTKHKFIAERFGIICPYCFNDGCCGHLIAIWNDGYGWLDEPSGTEFYIPLLEISASSERTKFKSEQWCAARIGPLSQIMSRWEIESSSMVSIEDFLEICRCVNISLISCYRGANDIYAIPQMDLTAFFCENGEGAVAKIQQAWTQMEIEIGGVWVEKPIESPPVWREKSLEPSPLTPQPKRSLRWRGRGANGEVPPNGEYLHSLIAQWASNVRANHVPDGTWKFLQWAMAGRVTVVLTELRRSPNPIFRKAALTIRELVNTLESDLIFSHWRRITFPWSFLKSEIMPEQKLQQSQKVRRKVR